MDNNWTKLNKPILPIEPPEAAICAQVLPSLVETETKLGLLVTRSLTTSGLLDWAAK